MACSAGAAEAAPKIELEKMNSSQAATGPYSYFVPPYSYYYFHNMDKLGFRLDWVRRSGPVYALLEMHSPFSTTYTYKDHAYTLEQYYQRNAVLGFLEGQSHCYRTLFPRRQCQLAFSFQLRAKIADLDAHWDRAGGRQDC